VLEVATDKCKNVANILEQISVKHSLIAYNTIVYCSLLILIIVLALIFDYINGFHDAANAVQRVVATRFSVSAVVWAAFLILACCIWLVSPTRLPGQYGY
jgi:hypothetical protein